jgi:hypothetical protein
MSAAFVGDFSGVSRYLSLSMSVRYVLSAAGAVGASIVMFWFGRELRRWIPGHVSRAFGVIGVAVLPVIAGTALIVLINQPVPASIDFVPGRVTEQSFQIFAIIGAATGARPTASTSLQLRWIDGVIAVAVVLIVRVMTMGIHLNA